MLDLMGKRYITEHCVSLFHIKQKEMLFRVYVTDGIQVLTNTLCEAFGGDMLSSRYWDLINVASKTDKQKDERDANEIKSRIMNTVKRLASSGGDVDGSIEPES